MVGKVLIFMFSVFMMVCTCSAATSVMVAYPVIADILSPLTNEANIVVRSLIPIGNERIDHIVSPFDLDVVSHENFYLTIGMEWEDAITRDVSLRQSGCQFFSLTNKCEIIDGNPYLWLSPFNRMKMLDNAIQIVRKIKSDNACGGVELLRGHFARRDLLIDIRHPALEYLCEFYKIKFIRGWEDTDKINFSVMGDGTLGNVVCICTSGKSTINSGKDVVQSCQIPVRCELNIFSPGVDAVFLRSVVEGIRRRNNLDIDEAKK